MSLPQDNERGYLDSSVMTHVDKLVGRLMLVHGMVDENVHFRHTARLITALTRARKEYELLLFPDERHLPRSAADRVYMEQRIATFFERHL
jgi:dipeptidyl-peptidase 4